MLEGPTSIAFIESAGDPAAVAKALATTAKGTSVLSLRGGILEGRALSGEEIVRAKPSAAKGRYIKQITLTTTMGPGIRVDSTKTRDIADELAESAGADSAREVVSA